MRKWMVALCCAAIAAPAAAQTTTNDRELVRQAILDYVEGIYNVEPERIARSVHPTLAKRGFQVPKDSSKYQEYPMTFAQLENVARNFNKTGRVKADAPKKIEIFEVLDQTATAKLTAVWGIDYFHLAKYNGKWMIVNVLWQAPPEGHPNYRKPAGSKAGGGEANDDLAALSDEFSDAAKLSQFRQHHEVEGWTNKLKKMEVSSTGSLVLEPYTSVWFYDYSAPFAFKEVEGDFMVTSRLRVHGTKTPYPQSTYSLAGLMVRQPRTAVPFTSDDKWPKDRENYIFAVTGTTDEPGEPILETKSAIRSRPLVKHYPLENTNWLEIRVARIGPSFVVLYRPDGGEWTVHERFFRPDLPSRVQAGVMVYSDFATIDAKHWYRPWEYNKKVITDGVADMTAEFDYVRYARVSVPPESARKLAALGVTWDDYRISNADLVALVPGLVR